MTCNCSKCGKVRDESELTPRMTGEGFSRRIRYYCTNSCLGEKVKQTQLNQTRAMYRKGLRVRCMHQY